MTIVVADISNHRQCEPKMDILQIFEDNVTPVGWKTVFNRNCNKIVIMGKTPISLVTIRGAVYDAAGHNIDEVRISGVRCPIHTMKVVSKMGNKTIIDIVFALDPTNIIEMGSGQFCMDIRFPTGFSPMCLASKECEFQQLVVSFKPLGIIAIDISPVSFHLLWGMGEKCTVILTQGDEEIITLKDQVHKLEIENMDPSTTYSIKVIGSSTYNLDVTTEELSAQNMRQYVSSKKDECGTIDLSILDSKYTKFIRSIGILQTGQVVRIRGELENEKYIYTARIVSPGETLDIDNSVSKNVYIVPDFSENEEQFFCLTSEGLSHIINFDKSEEFVRYQDKVYNHGDKFMVSNRFVQVAKGSIILVVGDDVPADFPYDNATALQTLTSGDLVVKDLIMRSSSQVVEKVDGQTTWGLSSFYVYDSTAGTTLESSRISSGINDLKDTGTVKFSVLYTDGLGDQSLIDTLNTSPSETTIRSKTDSADTTATFSTEGLSFDTAAGSIYFGATKEFRIQFQEVDGLSPAMLTMQSLNGGSYVTRFLITDQPV